jgi:co-chaperonin GroES (HSP10)|tara:strand:- start:3056 stop:3493 length:438 start_codon:yes stop_codon:yes gene_type:complete
MEKSNMQQPALAKAIKNDEWISSTEEEVKDPSPLPFLPGYHVLIRPVTIKATTKGGILIPDSTKDDMAYLTTVGRVLMLGDLAYQDEAKFSAGPWCSTGDYVCYGKHAGVKMLYKGVRLLLLFDDQVMMRVENAKYLDPTFNLSA